MKTKKLLISAACTSILLLSSQESYASAYASAVLDITNFKLTKGDGTSGNLGTALTAADFTSIAANNSGAATATMNGITETDSQGPVNIFTPSQGSINITNQWVGSNTLGDDNYSLIPPPALVNYANGDSDLSGSIIDLGNGAGANAQTRADISLVTGGFTGDTQSNLSLSATAIFTAGSALASGFTISFDYINYLATQLTLDEIIPGAVNANSSWSVRLRKSGGTGVAYNKTFTLEELNLVSSFDAPFNGTEILHETGSAFFYTGALDILNTYTMTIKHDTNVSATAAASGIPEPGSLSLIGLGLFGFALARKKTS